MKILVLAILFSFGCASQKKTMSSENAEKTRMVADKILESENKTIEACFWKMVQDRLVVYDEMVEFDELLQNFRKHKTKFDKEIRLYEISTTVDLNPDFAKLTEVYFFRTPTTKNLPPPERMPKDDKFGTCKALLEKITGMEMTIYGLFPPNNNGWKQDVLVAGIFLTIVITDRTFHWISKIGDMFR